MASLTTKSTESRRTGRDSSASQNYSAVKHVVFSESMNSRFRSTMEDAHVIMDRYGGDPRTGFFGVYDGHGGRNVAEFLRLHLHKIIETELRNKGSRSVEECLKAGYLATDIECSKTKEPAAGATAITCIVRTSGSHKYIYTANCGDARAVLCHDGRAVRLSRDHKATDADEIARIEACGGFVARKRVMGVLAVARSFGDFVLKNYVTAEPFTSTTRLDQKSRFVIIACDGLWDVLKDQEAVDFVQHYIKINSIGSEPWADDQKAQAKAASDALVARAIAAGSTDNVTVMIVFL